MFRCHYFELVFRSSSVNPGNEKYNLHQNNLHYRYIKLPSSVVSVLWFCSLTVFRQRYLIANMGRGSHRFRDLLIKRPIIVVHGKSLESWPVVWHHTHDVINTKLYITHILRCRARWSNIMLKCCLNITYRKKCHQNDIYN